MSGAYGKCLIPETKKGRQLFKADHSSAIGGGPNEASAGSSRTKKKKRLNTATTQKPGKG